MKFGKRNFGSEHSPCRFSKLTGIFQFPCQFPWNSQGNTNFLVGLRATHREIDLQTKAMIPSRTRDVAQICILKSLHVIS